MSKHLSHMKDLTEINNTINEYNDKENKLSQRKICEKNNVSYDIFRYYIRRSGNKENKPKKINLSGGNIEKKHQVFKKEHQKVKELSKDQKEHKSSKTKNIIDISNLAFKKDTDIN